MLKNYLKTAIRNLIKHKGTSAINISGLAIGMSCCIMIFLFVRHELSFDRFHSRGDRIHRLLMADREDLTDLHAVTSSGFAPHLSAEYPEIEQAARIFIQGRTLQLGTDTRRISGFLYADPAFFTIFDFDFKQGDRKKALDHPGSLVVSESAARTWFGDENPVGREILLLTSSRKTALQITGVVADPPSHSHLRFDYVVPFADVRSFMGENALTDYTNYNYYTYFLMRKGTSSGHLTARSEEFFRKYVDEDAAETRALVFQPLYDIHLTTNIRFDIGTNASRLTLYIFTCIAVFVLMIASINFMNLATARSLLRAEEVGVRKVLGASRGQLVLQFLGEAMVGSGLAVIAALGLTLLFGPSVGSLLGRDVSLNPLGGWSPISILFGVGLLSGLLSGTYPALFLSRFDPNRAIKSRGGRGSGGGLFRKSLIVVQFSIGVFLLIAVATVYRQLDFMRSRDLGFDREQVAFFNITGPIKSRFDTFRTQLLADSRIRSVSLMGNLPGRVRTSRGYNWPSAEEEEAGRGFYTMLADAGTVETFGLEIVAGRDFSERIASDIERAFILNETAVRELGWEDPIGHPFRVWDEEMGLVVGVVKDFHFKSMHAEIEPLVIDYKTDWSWMTAVRFHGGGDLDGLVGHIRETWTALEGEQPFNLRFLDEDFNRLYQSDVRQGKLFSVFTGLALFVACLGLFGMVAFAAEMRRKEIGIRKVLGASTLRLVAMMSGEFCLLVAVAFAIAAPLAFVVMNGWLGDFAYRVPQNFAVILGVGALSLLLAAVTVSTQAFRTASSDPVDCIRYE